MQPFNSGREAKEYLIARIVQEAEREGVPLSEPERKMMYFSETAWTLPDIWEVNEAFERDYDEQEYEAKIGELVRKARAHAAVAKELSTWKKAVQVLKREDHYLLVLLTASAGPSSLLVDRLKLIGTAVIVCALLLAGVFFFSR